MFDIGFSELVVIGVVALVVIGPERLPKVARTMGILFGRMQRYVTQVKADINREMDLAELNKVKGEFEGAARSFRSEVESKAAETERELREAGEKIDRELATTAADSATAEFPHGLLQEPAAPAPAPEAPMATAQLELGIEETDAPARAPDPAPAAKTPGP
jgi:sec-independent protein translocase protein TatB